MVKTRLYLGLCLSVGLAIQEGKRGAMNSSAKTGGKDMHLEWRGRESRGS